MILFTFSTYSTRLPEYLLEKRERDRETDRQTDRERETERERDGAYKDNVEAYFPTHCSV